MNSNYPYCLFGLPVSRRTFFLTMILCPGLALVIALSTMSRRAALNS